MILLGVGIVWLGYTGAWWGWNCLQGRVKAGSNWPDLLDLIVPGRTPTATAAAAAPPAAGGQPQAPSLAPSGPRTRPS